LYDVSEMARLSHILYDRRSPNHLILKAPDARHMAEKGGASAAVSAVIAKAKLSGMWREKPELTKSGPVTVKVVWPNVN
jgi:hypothetical protein